MTFTISTRPQEINWECADRTERICQNASNLLHLMEFELPFDRYAGLDMRMHDFDLQTVEDNIEQEARRVLLWEPRCELAEVRLVQENNQMIVECDIEVNTDE